MRAAPPGETSKQEVEPLARELEAGLQKAEEPDIDSLQEKARKKAIAATEAAQRKGVVYLSRCPPHLKPQKLRHILSQYGDVGRLYLAPEDPGLRKRRKKLKKNTGKNFSEGWVEFMDKRVAKRVAEMLNGNPMGGKRRSAHHYDIWCLQYLPKFKWDHLTEEIAYQNAVREQKLAAEISAAKRERDFYMSRVDRARGAEAKAKRQKRKAQEGSGEEAAATTSVQPAVQTHKVLRTYGQKRPKLDPTDDTDAPVMPQDVLSLLGGKK